MPDEALACDRLSRLYSGDGLDEFRPANLLLQVAVHLSGQPPGGGINECAVGSASMPEVTPPIEIAANAAH